jgi:hypothetical protein
MPGTSFAKRSLLSIGVAALLVSLLLLIGYCFMERFPDYAPNLDGGAGDDDTTTNATSLSDQTGMPIIMIDGATIVLMGAGVFGAAAALFLLVIYPISLCVSNVRKLLHNQRASGTYVQMQDPHSDGLVIHLNPHNDEL